MIVWVHYVDYFDVDDNEEEDYEDDDDYRIEPRASAYGERLWRGPLTGSLILIIGCL